MPLSLFVTVCQTQSFDTLLLYQCNWQEIASVQLKVRNINSIRCLLYSDARTTTAEQILTADWFQESITMSFILGTKG